MFNLKELSELFTKINTFQSWNVCDFALHLQWTLNSQQVNIDSGFRIYTGMKDYNGALSVSKKSKSFDLERCVYHLLSLKYDSLASAVSRALFSANHYSPFNHLLHDTTGVIDKGIFLIRPIS